MYSTCFFHLWAHGNIKTCWRSSTLRPFHILTAHQDPHQRYCTAPPHQLLSLPGRRASDPQAKRRRGVPGSIQQQQKILRLINQGFPNFISLIISKWQWIEVHERDFEQLVNVPLQRDEDRPGQQQGITLKISWAEIKHFINRQSLKDRKNCKSTTSYFFEETADIVFFVRGTFVWSLISRWTWIWVNHDQSFSHFYSYCTFFLQGQFFFEQHLLFHQMEDLLNKYKVTFISKKDYKYHATIILYCHGLLI